MAMIFTVGYGGRSPQSFVELLQRHQVPLVVDVRLRPDRASMGAYVLARSSEKGIQRLLADAGLGYLSLVELGNVFLGFPDWPARYQRLLRESGELLTARLREVPPPFTLLCAEKRHDECHRTLVADWLTAYRGDLVQHLE